MARPRRTPKPSKPSRSERTRRDNARARRLGYKSYYDYRLHASGRLPPRFTFAPHELPGMRGHGDLPARIRFLLSLGEGDLILLPYGLSSVEFDESARKGAGAYVEIVKVVIDGDDGSEREYTFGNVTRAEMIQTIEEEQRRGAVFSPAPSLDQRRLVDGDDVEGGY